MIEVTKLKPNLDKLSPNSSNYDELYREIYDKFTVLEGETSQRIMKHLKDKNFYLGEPEEHWDKPQELSDSHPIINYAHAVDNKYADLLTAGEMPGLQLMSPSDDEQVKAFASAGEGLLYKILEQNIFQKKMHYGAIDGSMLGNTFFYTYYDPDKKIGDQTGIPIVETRSPFFIRVGFAKDNWNEIEYWIGETRMTPSEVKRKFGVEVEGSTLGGRSSGSGATINSPFDSTNVETQKTYIEMVPVLDYHDNEKDAILVGDQVLFAKANKYGHGLWHIRNRTAPNEPWGYSDHYNIIDANKLLNKNYGQAQEIIASHASPMIIDYGSLLGGRRLKTRHNTVITAQTRQPGEGLEYLQWNGNIYPLDSQIKNDIQSIYDLSEMPPAAFGSFQPGGISGFALTVQMQPTLMRIKLKQNAEWGPVLTEMFKSLLRMAIDNTKSIGIPKEVADFTIKVIWPNPLPREDAREIQNAVALVTNKLSSKETAMQDLLIQDVVQEKKRIESETINDAKIMGEAQAAVQSAIQPQGQPGQVQGQGETALNSPIQPGQSAEQAFPNFPEQNRATPQSTGLDQGQSIAPTSTEQLPTGGG